METSTCSYGDLQGTSHRQDFLLWEDAFPAFAKKQYEIYGLNCINEKNCFGLYKKDEGKTGVPLPKDVFIGLTLT